MRSSWKRDWWPVHRRRGVDRGCPLGTGVVRPMWHAGGTAADDETPSASGEHRPIPLPARRVRDPLPPVAEAGHPAPEAFEYTGWVQVGSCCLAWPPSSCDQARLCSWLISSPSSWRSRLGRCPSRRRIRYGCFPDADRAVGTPGNCRCRQSIRTSPCYRCHKLWRS